MAQFRITSEKPLCVEIKLTHDDSEQRNLISYQKRGRPVQLEEVQLLPLYSGPRQIAKAKVNDVKSVCAYMPPIHHEFYNNIAVDKHKTSAEPSELTDDGGAYNCKLIPDLALLTRICRVLRHDFLSWLPAIITLTCLVYLSMLFLVVSVHAFDLYASTHLSKNLLPQ